MSKTEKTRRRDMPRCENAAGGWGALSATGSNLADQKITFEPALMRQNTTGRHIYTSCAWTKAPEQHLFESHANGARRRSGTSPTTVARPSSWRSSLHHGVAAYCSEADPVIPVRYHDELFDPAACDGVPVRTPAGGAGG